MAPKLGRTRRPQKCKYCPAPATKSLVWAEHMAYVPVCNRHDAKGRRQIDGEVEAVHKIEMARRKGDHESTIHPDVPNKSGKTNWVEQEGHLPRYIERVAKHIIADSGYTVSRAIAAAVSQTKKRAAKGNGEAAAAIAQWYRMRAAAKARPNKGGRSDMARVLDDAVIALAADVSQAGQRTTVSYGTGPSQKARSQAQSKGQAFKQGRYPIRNVSDLQKAIRAFGRVKPEDKSALKRFIQRRARELGRSDLIPESWRTNTAATRRAGTVELAGKRGPYQRHVAHTKQFGKKKGDLSKKADWRHGYAPRTDVAMALKAKHLTKDDLTSTGNPEPGKLAALDKAVPPHLQKYTQDKRDVRKEGDDKVRSGGSKKPKDSSTLSGTELRKRRNRLEAKRRAGTLTPKEKTQLNQIVHQLSERTGKTKKPS